MNRDDIDKSSVLCAPSSTNPVTVWMVGLVKNAWFISYAGKPFPQVTIYIRPLKETAFDRARTLIKQLSSPKIGMYCLRSVIVHYYLRSFVEGVDESWGSIRASKWQTVRGSGEDAKVVSGYCSSLGLRLLWSCMN